MQSLQQTSLLIGLLYLTTVYTTLQPACVQEHDRDIDVVEGTNRGGSEYVDGFDSGNRISNVDKACCTECQARQPQCLAFKYYDAGECYLFKKLSSNAEGCEHLPDTNINVAAGGGKILITRSGIADATTCCAHCKGNYPKCVAYVYYNTDEICHLIEKLGPIQVKAGVTSGFMKSCSNDVRAQTSMWRSEEWKLDDIGNINYIDECCAKCREDDRCIAFLYDSDHTRCLTTANPGAEQPKVPGYTFVYARTGHYKHYTVTLKTGDEDGAGTDSNKLVFVQFTGEDGKTTRKIWLVSGDEHKGDDEYDEFARKSVKVFQVYAKNVGKLTGVIVSKPESASDEKWKLNSVQVMVPGDKTYWYPFNKWLQGANIEARTHIQYKLWVTTANEPNDADTDANVHFKFIGEKGITNEVQLDNLPEHDDFALAATDEYTAYFTDVGKLLLATVRMTRWGQGGEDTWKLSKVVVEVTGQGTYTFNFDTWINEASQVGVVSVMLKRSCSNDKKTETSMWRDNEWKLDTYNTADIDVCCAKCRADDRCIAFVYDSDRQECLTTDNPLAEQPKVPSRTLVYVRQGYYKHYTVTLTTADEDGAGTDSNRLAYVRFTGENGKTTRWLWLVSARDGKYDEFARNSVKVFQLYAKDVGKLKDVKVHKTTASGEKWKVERVDVNVPDDKEYSYAFDLWIDQPNGRYRLDGRAISATDKLYNITVTTVDEDDAGTESSVYIKFEGQRGTTNEAELNSVKNKFLRNAFSSDLFHAYFTDVGKLKSATVRISGIDPWKPSTIVVEVEGHGTFTFNFTTWVNESTPATVVPVPTEASNSTEAVDGNATMPRHNKGGPTGPTDVAAGFPAWAIGLAVGLAVLLLIIVALVLMRKRDAAPPSDASKTANVTSEKFGQELNPPGGDKPVDNATVLPAAGPGIGTMAPFGKEGADTVESASETSQASSSSTG